MKHDEFLYQVERLLYKENSKNLNLMLGKKKTNQLSTGLFLKLPMQFELIQKPNLESTFAEPVDFIANNFSAYVVQDDSVSVYMTFFYSSEPQLDNMLKFIEKHSILFAFIYMHEVSHIIRMHNTSNYDRLMLNIASDISNPIIANQLINVAEDYAINYSLKDLMDEQYMYSEWSMISKTCLYNKNYHDKKLSDMQILKLLVKDIKTNQSSVNVSPSIDGFESVELSTKSSGSNQSIQPTKETKKPSSDSSSKSNSSAEYIRSAEKSDQLDNEFKELSKSIRDLLAESTKGTTSYDILEESFSSIEVETGWFKKIKSSFKRHVYYQTNIFTSSWSGINSVYRNIFLAPKRKFMDDKVQIILAIDQSGSMPQDSLQKLLYLFESEGKRVSKLTALIHDTEISKEFVIESGEYDIKKNKLFKSALATRYKSGGTSHSCIFKRLSEFNKKELNESIFVCFSDMESNIEGTINSYPHMKHIKTFWVHTGRTKLPTNIHGTHIYIS